MHGNTKIKRRVCCLLCRLRSAQQTTHKPFHDLLPHLNTIYNDVILLNVLTEVNFTSSLRMVKDRNM